MSSARRLGVRSSFGAIMLALVGACSSERSDSEPVPLWTGPDVGEPSSDAPSASAGTSSSTPQAAAPGPVPSEGAPSSEAPLTPRLVPSSEGGGGSSASGTDPSAAASGSGGATGAGQAGAGPAAPTGEAANARPSAMCGAAGPAPVFDLPNTLSSVPPSYDGTTPLPVVLAFHAAGNPNTQLRGILGDALDDDYIVLYPKSAGNGWTNQDAAQVDAMFDALDAIACYDQNRVFATGHSSGAQFIVQRLCAGETRWRAVAPVASSVYCSSWEPIPALVIHGIGDVERQAYGLNDGDGLKDIVPYRTSNGCQESFTEVPIDGCTSGGTQVSPGCRDFDGCSEPTRWCQHDDPQYGTSHHGVPCFGARVIKDFFDSFR